MLLASLAGAPLGRLNGLIRGHYPPESDGRAGIVRMVVRMALPGQHPKAPPNFFPAGAGGNP
jgi:hypothetical protein